MHFELRRRMLEKDVEIILQRAHERFVKAKPRIISDNGPQFIAKCFKLFIRQVGMKHIRTSAYYPQSNGKLERYHKAIKQECIRPKVALSEDEVREQIKAYVRFYNEERLHSAIGYLTPKDRLEGRHKQIFKDRDLKLETARQARIQDPTPLKWPKGITILSSKPTIHNCITPTAQFSIST